MVVNSQSTATTLDVEGLVSMAWAGKIRVPRFQRSFRWSWEDVRRLFDSIVRGYPIGSLLLWTRSAPAQTLQLGQLTIEAPADSEALWVVDGQQRITSLANALHPDGQIDKRFALAYDLRKKEFDPDPRGERPARHPAASSVRLAFVAGLVQASARKWRATSTKRMPSRGSFGSTRSRRTKVSQDDPKVLQDIFDRMNNYGKRLSRAEVFSALNTREEDDGQAIEMISDRISADLRFGAIDDDTVLQAVLARRGPDVRRDIRHEFDAEGDEGRDAAFKAGEEALRRAVTFLQFDCFVPHITLLAYRYLLVTLTCLFAHHPNPDSRNRRLLRRWYWRAAVAGPQQFKGGTAAAARLTVGDVAGRRETCR